MATQDQIREWRQEGEAVRCARDDQRVCGERSPDEIKALRSEAAQTASCCADCFAPLSPEASVTLVHRFVEHIPGRYPALGISLPPRDVYLTAPICLHCWLISLADQPLSNHLQGVRQDDHLDRASPMDEGWEVRRLRCEGCTRPLRVETREFRRLPLPKRCCCADCLYKAKLKRANERRRVRHTERPCLACGKLFIPTQSTAKTCSATCRQRLFRQRRDRAPVFAEISRD
jgi:hypothetical protein